MRNLIPVKCTNQTLYFERLQPVITSGDINEDVIAFDFCPMWDGFQKTAVFYRSAVDVYHVLVDNENTCLIPKEVLADPGEVHFGVFGVKDDRRRTSEEILLTIKQGAITEATTVSDPTPDIYTQLVSMMNATSARVERTENGTKVTIRDVHGETSVVLIDGGYYVPGVEMRGPDSFDLYFEPTQEGMKAPQTFNIQIPAGPQGPQGEPGKDAVGEVFELYQTLSFEEPEAVDIKGLAFKRLFIRMTTTSTSSAFYWDAYSGSTRVAHQIFRALTDEDARYATAEVWNDAGWWRSQGNSWSSKKPVTSEERDDIDYYLKHSVKDYPYITRIKTSAAIPAGTTVEIWCVKADAYAVSTLEELEY